MGSNPIPRTTIVPPAVDTFSVVKWLKSQGRKESTILCTARKLRHLDRNVNLNDPERVKVYIAKLQCSDGHKYNLIDKYSQYARFNNIKWTKPKAWKHTQTTLE